MLGITNHYRNASQIHKRCYLTPVRMAIIKKCTNNKCQWECGEKGNIVHCRWECELMQPLWRTAWRFLKNLKIELYIWSRKSIPGYISQENKKTNSKSYICRGALLPLPTAQGSHLLSFNKDFACLLSVFMEFILWLCEQEPRSQYHLYGIIFWGLVRDRIQYTSTHKVSSSKLALSTFFHFCLPLRGWWMCQWVCKHGMCPGHETSAESWSEVMFKLLRDLIWLKGSAPESSWARNPVGSLYHPAICQEAPNGVSQEGDSQRQMKRVTRQIFLPILPTPKSPLSMYSYSLCKVFEKSQITIFPKDSNCWETREEQKCCFCKFFKGDKGFKVTIPDPLWDSCLHRPCFLQYVRSQHFTVNDVSWGARVWILMEIYLLVASLRGQDAKRPLALWKKKC